MFNFIECDEPFTDITSFGHDMMARRDDAEASSGIRISIITPVLNRADMILGAIESVQNQGVAEGQIEHLIADGGSTDGTLERLSGKPVTVINGPDLGPYDAVLRGMQAASGDVIGLLSSDDVYLPGCLQLVQDIFAQNPDVMAVAGEAIVFTQNGTVDCRVTAKIVHESTSDGMLDELMYGTPAINAWFFRRTVFESLGTYDWRRLPIAADRDFLLRVFEGGIRPWLIKRPVYAYRAHPDSNTLDPEHKLGDVILAEHVRLAQLRLKEKHLTYRQRAAYGAWLAHEQTEILMRHISKSETVAAFRSVVSLLLMPVCFVLGLKARRRVRRRAL